MAALHLLVYAGICLVFGIPMALWPYRLARWNEIIDSIGRKPAGRVEPADWLVTLTWVGGIALSVVGGILVVLAVFGYVDSW